MVRMRLLALLVLFLTVVSHAADSKLPWQRLLTGEDAKKAAGLQQRVEKLEASDQYTEAIGRKEELLALRTKVQGAEHSETVDQKWVLAALQKVAALPAEKRADRAAAHSGAGGPSPGAFQRQENQGATPAGDRLVRGVGGG